MSLNHIIDKGGPNASWTRLRSHSHFIDNDLDVIGFIRGRINHNNILPGLPRTFLHTDSLGEVNWHELQPEDIPAGNNDQILRVVAGVLRYEDKIVNSNLPDNPTFVGTLTTDDLSVNNGLIFNDLTINGNLTAADATITTGGVNVTGTSTFNNTIFGTSFDGSGNVSADSLDIANDSDFGGDVQFSNNSGNVGEVIVKTGATSQDWALLPESSVETTGATDGDVLTIVGGVSEWAAPSGGLPVGADGQYLGHVGGVPAWGDVELSSLSITGAAAGRVIIYDALNTTAIWGLPPPPLFVITSRKNSNTSYAPGFINLPLDLSLFNGGSASWGFSFAAGTFTFDTTVTYRIEFAGSARTRNRVAASIRKNGLSISGYTVGPVVQTTDPLEYTFYLNIFELFQNGDTLTFGWDPSTTNGTTTEVTVTLTRMQ